MHTQVLEPAVLVGSDSDGKEVVVVDEKGIVVVGVSKQSVQAYAVYLEQNIVLI